LGYLIAASVAPLLGPLLYRALHPRDKWVRLVDSFVYLAVPVLVGLQVLPGALEGRSALPLVLLAAGLLVPSLFERASRSIGEHTDRAALAVGLSGLALHALLEGAALPTAARGDVAFGAAIVVHRIPVGLVLWWLVSPRWGGWAGGAAVGALVALTVIGFAAAGGFVTSLGGAGIELYQAFVAGSLLHVVFHQGRQDHAHDHVRP
jgi:hypothetical protein